MSKKSNLSVAAASAFAVSLAASPLANAADNPFSLTEYANGYMVADAHEGNCGEKEGEGNCGEKEGEGNCGEKGDKGEGKCGEAKCGN